MDFTITDAGREAAFNAGAAGIKIEVATFKLATAYNYVVDPATDTDLRGTILYTGVPIGFSVIDEDECEFTLSVPGNVGTWEFGECGLYLNNGLHFATGVLEKPQWKVAAPGSGWNTVNIKARLQLVGISAIIQWVIQNLTVGVIIELGNLSLLPKPGFAPSNAYIVHQGDEQGNDTLVTSDAAGTWVVHTHHTKVLTNGEGAVLTSGSASSCNLDKTAPIEAQFPAGKYLIQPVTGLQKGLVRTLVSAAGSTLNWTPSFGAPLQPGDIVEILQSNSSVAESAGSEHGFFHALAARMV